METSAVSNNALIQKLIAVYAAVDHVEKRGRNEFQKYNYVKATDVARAIREAFKEQKIYARPTFSISRFYTVPAKEGEMQAVDVRCELEMICQETGANLFTNGFGSGTDKGDKALYKAQTGAMKYALRNAFLIPDESDPEADEEVDRQTSPARPQSGQTTQARSHSVQAAPRTQNTTTTAPALPTAPVITHSTPLAVDLRHDLPVKANIPTPKTAESAVTPVVTTVEVNPVSLPSKEQYDAYIQRAIVLAADLEKAGLKAGRGLPAKTKLKKYLLSVCKVEKLEDLSVGQWDTFFEAAQKMFSSNPVQFVASVENANTKEEK